jgi:hypothetical protein
VFGGDRRGNWGLTSASAPCREGDETGASSGFHSNIIGRWPSHPVEPIRGAMISNFYQRAVGPLGKPWPMAPGTGVAKTQPVFPIPFEVRPL